ncbi:TetR/AcrR family transcriptional regulator [Pseudomonas sp. MYb185]|uniref:TetR/AcrR family transcriptional regulator n=1 Tax=Pseudomonas sp. MYb185 TaxID=1848729 RepID=UPI000CFB080B|nr:TetR/AcrR family transcriptional regulator [Pseudomonas sp. MYb185]PRB84247.1 TetR family transcriptional regulator [Pseudomonas sp. MYb185]
MSEKIVQNAGPGRPKDPAKREAILLAAQQLFLDSGYEGTSMDAIAAEAGVSKLTVYSHFTDKETLYAAAIRAVCEAQLPDLFFDYPQSGDMRCALQRIGDAFCRLINSPESIALHRLLVSMAGQDIKLAQLFYEVGPQRVCDGMAQFLGQAEERGDLCIDEPPEAARRFFSLLKGDHHFRLLIGYAQIMSDQERHQHVADIVELFLRLHAPMPA